MKESKAIDTFRRQFFKERLHKVRDQGILVFDEASLLLQNEESQADVLVSDTFSNDRNHGSIAHFIAGVSASWWAPRQSPTGVQSHLKPAYGFYAHFLPQVSFDIIFEFRSPELAPAVVWRVDARGNAEALPPPDTDGDFRDQTGTFFDLRFGWSWIAQQFGAQKAMVAAEVETGYVIGIRAAKREGRDEQDDSDLEVTELADRYGRTRFDCAEVLNESDVDTLPFASEMFCASMLERYLPGALVEVFVLASSECFVAMIEEFADQAEVEVQVKHRQSKTYLTLSKGTIVQTIDLAYPFLRTLYTARSFPDGVKAFVNPVIEQIGSAHDIYEKLVQVLPDYVLSVDEFGVLTVTNERGEVLARNSLFRLSGQLWTGSSQSESQLLTLLGLDPVTKQRRCTDESLTQCRVCGGPARVSKNIRPKYSIGDDAQKFAGLATDRHLIYYVQECALHTIPLELEPGQGYGELEASYQSGLATAKTHLLSVQDDSAEGLWSFVGHDVASAVLEPGRITGLIAHFGLKLEKIWALAFYPDVLVITSSKPNAEMLDRLRHQSRESVHSLFPDRLWLIDMIRPIEPDSSPVGIVEIAS
jgi:hypothetical protein